jgi:hypothetical protein
MPLMAFHHHRIMLANLVSVPRAVTIPERMIKIHIDPTMAIERDQWRFALAKMTQITEYRGRQPL